MIYDDGRKPMPKRLRRREIDQLLEKGELAHHVHVDPRPEPKDAWQLHYCMHWWFGCGDEYFVYYRH